LKTACRG